MISKKAFIKEIEKFGKGIFAKEDISKGDLVADWTGGEIYIAGKCSDLPEGIRDYVIQFDKNKWIDISDARHLNHSCNPNCGFSGKFKLVAMRDIREGEQITFDYEMCENSDWKMECKCGSKSCRKIIGSFKNLPKKMKKRYGSYISEWLR